MAFVVNRLVLLLVNLTLASLGAVFDCKTLNDLLNTVDNRKAIYILVPCKAPQKSSVNLLSVSFVIVARNYIYFGRLARPPKSAQ